VDTVCDKRAQVKGHSGAGFPQPFRHQAIPLLVSAAARQHYGKRHHIEILLTKKEKNT
jgi:hypothetical protein